MPYVTWDIGPNAPQDVLDQTRTGIVLMHNYTSSLAALPADTRPVTVYLYYLYYDDWDALAPKYARRTGMSTSDALEFLSTSKALGDVGPGFMVLFAANLAKEPPGVRRWTAAHELVHNYQDWNSWYGLPYDQIPRPDQVHPRLGPVWLFEGCDDFQVARAFDAAGALQYDQNRELTVRNAQNLSVPLKDIETRTEARKYPGSAYQLGYLACELLAHISGRSVPSTYWSLVGPDTSWQDAFRQFFGPTIEEFYPRSQKHRAAGFPVLSSQDQSGAQIVNVTREDT